ncbi:MAG: hypothetical protein AABW51_01365 [Nanoarchaeota archaeon]
MPKEKQKKSKKWVILFIILAVILLLVGGIYSYDKYFKKEAPKKQSAASQSSGTSNSKPIVYRVATQEDYKNFEEILQKNDLINKLPDDAKIVLAFYNFYTRERVWEASYLLSKGKVEKGTLDDYDIKLMMHSKYITILNENNLCSIIQLAQRNGDFGSETQASKLSLAWKYKSIMSYKDCLGL